MGGGFKVKVNEDLKFFVKMQKKFRVDVNEELKLLWKCKKNNRGVVRSGRGWGLVDREGVGWQQCWG